MKSIKNLSLALILSFSLLSVAHAQSEEDPLAGIDDLFDALTEIEESESFDQESSTEESTGDSMTESTTESSTEESTTTEESATTENSPESTQEETSTEDKAKKDELRKKLASNRFEVKTAPTGKESHVLYNLPGAIDYRGMTFLKMSSPKFLNRFQRCNTSDAQKTYNTLARLKISQGAPLECRESMEFEIIPYLGVYRSR